MSSGSQPNAQDSDGLEAAVDQVIAAYGGDVIHDPKRPYACRQTDTFPLSNPKP